jgi:hypothetical protein
MASKEVCSVCKQQTGDARADGKLLCNYCVEDARIFSVILNRCDKYSLSDDHKMLLSCLYRAMRANKTNTVEKILTIAFNTIDTIHLRNGSIASELAAIISIYSEYFHILDFEQRELTTLFLTMKNNKQPLDAIVKCIVQTAKCIVETRTAAAASSSSPPFHS